MIVDVPVKTIAKDSFLVVDSMMMPANNSASVAERLAEMDNSLESMSDNMVGQNGDES
ncbi:MULTISPECIES: hypothetical protein [Bacillaceae]|uniref:hypothetical protein n=1 Tax=Bacillaceae TaxID=186817 RepID=UPI001CDAE332|nr:MULTISPECIES: hypothetical protein [Bacillaceae]MED4473623.1 hypothetical protein [Oceanobacillus caeni]